MVPPLRVLAVAAATGRVGMALLVGWELKLWDCSSVAADSPESAAWAIKSWIESCDAKIAITEAVTKSSRKGDKTKALIAAMHRQALDDGLLTIAVVRPRNHKNKYIEAEELILKYPELRHRQPKREKIYHTEPRSTVIFEALALAGVVRRNGTIGLTAAMG